MKYIVNGSYSFHGKENPYTGLFKIKDDKITGLISDPDPSRPRHEINGHVTYLDDRVILEFVKGPGGTLMADIFYKLEKSDKREGMAGEYKGFWSFKDQKVIKLCIGYKPGVGEAVMVIPENERENKTHLRLG